MLEDTSHPESAPRAATTPYDFPDGEPFELEVAGQTIPLGGDDVLIETHSAEGYSCEADPGYLAALDTTLNDELVAEVVVEGESLPPVGRYRRTLPKDTLGALPIDALLRHQAGVGGSGS